MEAVAAASARKQPQLTSVSWPDAQGLQYKYCESQKFREAYKGCKLKTAQAEKLEARRNRYLYEINSRWTIDGRSRKTLARYAAAKI